ncbi:S-adenosyl-L-methionine-dependent methyltransferase [Mycena rosella]|uniref:S-adenosyl-L-methionine-dependent methyltransferase n=1 Tax=Mycena rosella TaxID=1033263 RepID=A0AAD7E0R9_MYCRO|nr:S-adenosyl-L-methionine-dependent methyltransferase [Mycena rosella]
MPVSVPALFVAACLAFYVFRSGVLRPYIKFIWHCFIRPIGVADQKSRLDEFYQGQADVYDATRNGLLRGRKTMLSLSAAHLKALRAASPNKRLVWIDIGGGTGHNIELMNAYMPISSFDAVYLIDLCEPLLDVARARFAKKGWTNVTVLCQDASEFSLPEWINGKDPKGSVGFVSLSYSLSMASLIPSFYTVLDRIEHVLCPQDGLISVVDFYTAGKQPSLHEKAIGGASKECGWLSRWFWQIWFDFDHVSLSPARRSYLEYKFGTIKSFNGRNRFIIPFIVRIPYYIWLGRPRSCDVSRACHAFEVEGGNMIGNCSPVSLKAIKGAEDQLVPSLQIGEPVLEYGPEATTIDITPPFSSFHYHIKSSWRLPYYEQPVHKEFRTFIYSFTWEDPFEDMKHLQLSSNDSMFVITSAGDNALHYAAASSPQRIHCVDMNPCQGHLMELKLAAIQSLDYEDFFALFGLGRHPNFRGLLDSKIAPYLSSSAYQFWRIKSQSFKSSFYLRGYSGWALRLTSFIFRLAGASKDIEALCNADTLEQQEDIWKRKIRPVILNPLVVALLKNPVFCWNALGVPLNQRKMLLDEGGVYEFIRDTLDPLASAYLFKTGNYFYLLALLGHYTPSSCPQYLTRSGFETLKANNGKVLNAFRLHTDSIVHVLRGLTDASLTRALIMDHLDWFTPGSPAIDEELAQLHRVLATGGSVFWRSAARKPWYNANFERRGFKVTALGVRQGPEAAIDRVNMYASFWRAVKI